jgi:phenylpropionate dioxygenase-like ring-hydroxylating dioxygenase large terminal subunit
MSKLIQNHWYLACASSQCGNQPIAARVGEKKLALFRDETGSVHALLDRCCHRGFPLSQGTLRNGRLACGFHGWEYDGRGQCARIPSQAENKPIPKSHCVPSFPCVEKDGGIWVWIGEKTPGQEPSIPEFSSGTWLQGSRIIHCHYLRALEITFDGPHVYFVHPTHPATLAAQKSGFAEQTTELRMTQKGCLVFGPATGGENDPIPPYAYQMEFELPGRIRFEFMMGPLGKGYMYFFITPTGESECRVDWLITNPDPNAPHVLWGGEGREIIGEDQIVLELIQKSYDLEGESFEKSVEADIPTLTLRKIVQLAEKEEWDPEKSLLPRRRVFSLMGPAAFV